MGEEPMTTLVADIESDGLLPTITKIHQISILDLETGVLDSYPLSRGLHEPLDRLLNADRVIMHGGIAYDAQAINKVYGPGHARDDNIVDTLVLSRLGNPEREGGHSLAAWGERLGHRKVVHEDWATWSPAMENRCNEDVMITAKVWARLAPMFDAMPVAVALEHAVARETAHMLARGFGLDVPYAQALAAEFMGDQAIAADNLRTLFPPLLVPKNRAKPERTLKNVNRRHTLHGQLDPGSPYCPVEVEEFNPASRDQIARRLVLRHGWKPRKFTPTGAPEVSYEVLRGLPYAESGALADYLERDKKLGQLQSEPKADGRGGGWLHHVTVGGRVHANLNPNRTVTGRPACSGPNIQQVDTDKAMRRAWVPGPGKVLVGVDASGLELRCLAHYLHRLDGGEYAEELVKGDIHAKVQEMIGFHTRDITKNVEYSLVYGGGDVCLGRYAILDAQAAGEDPPVVLAKYKRNGTWHEKYSSSQLHLGRNIRAKLMAGIPGLEALTSSVKATAQSGKLRAIDGRTLWLRSPHSALCFLCQSAGIIIMKQAISTSTAALAAAGLVEDRDFALVMWVHDEVQYEARPECAQQVGDILCQQIVDAGPALGFKCPLDAKALIGSNWSETH